MHSRDGASGDRGPHEGRRSRRSVLAATAGAALGAVGTAGCLADGDRVRVLAAGSLATVLEDRVGPEFRAETGIEYQGEYHGSTALLRMVAEGSKHPDVAISADVDLLRERLYPDRAAWDLAFATNEVGIAYAPETDLGGRLAAGEPWYEVFADADDGAVAISDPELDPLGYRAVHLFELAAREHDLEGFREAMLERVSREPDEPQLLAGVEAGTRACAVAYRNMAAAHDVPFLALPDAYNFGSLERADRYAEATYTTDEGETIAGSPTVYAATVPSNADEPAAGEAFVEFLVANPDVLVEHGLHVDDSFPRANGSVPEGI